jgi:hypothetical protein
LLYHELLQPETKHLTRPGITALWRPWSENEEKNLLFYALGLYYSQITIKQWYMIDDPKIK